MKMIKELKEINFKKRTVVFILFLPISSWLIVYHMSAARWPTLEEEEEEEDIPMQEGESVAPALWWSSATAADRLKVGLFCFGASSAFFFDSCTYSLLFYRYLLLCLDSQSLLLFLEALAALRPYI